MRSANFSKWFVVIVISCAAAIGAEPARIIYVDGTAGGSGDGASWANACKHLQDGLALAVTADKPVEIHVAQGVYKPDQGAGVTPGDRAATFQQLSGVALKGGYAGATAPVPNMRDPRFYETTLSGDLAGNDGTDRKTRDDNSCCVVACSGTDATAVLDGFTITAGYRARGQSYRARDQSGPELSSEGGSAMLMNAASPTVLNCSFVANYDWWSGGVVAVRNGSNPVLTRCEFLNNEGTSIYNSGNSNPILIDCRFQDNTRADLESSDSSPVIRSCQFIRSGGCAIRALDCNLVLTKCVFEGSSDEMGGQGIDCTIGSLSLTECTFTGLSGRAIHIWGDLTLVRCTFTNNRGALVGAVDCSGIGYITALECAFAGNDGMIAGAIIGTDMELHDCEFTGNSGHRAGAVETRGGVMIAAGCVFSGNSAIYGAGAISSWSYTQNLSNCTFVGNRGRSNTLDTRFVASLPRFTQCIIWDGPEPFGDYPWGPASVDITYSNVQGG